MAAMGPVEYKETGNKYFKEQKWREAAEQYTQGLSFESVEELPNDLRGLLLSNRSQCWINLSSWQKADDDANACLKLLPEHLKALFRRAVARERLGMTAEAFSDYSKVAKADPKNLDAVKAAQRLRDHVMRKDAQKHDSALPANLVQVLRSDDSTEAKVDACLKMEALIRYKHLAGSLISAGALELLIDIGEESNTPEALRDAAMFVLLGLVSGKEGDDDDEKMTRSATDNNSTTPLAVPPAAVDARARVRKRLSLPSSRRACRGIPKSLSRLALIIGLTYEPEEAEALEAIHDAIDFLEGGEFNVPRAGILSLTTMLDTRRRLGKAGKPLMPTEPLLKCLETALGTTSAETALVAVLSQTFTLLADSDRPPSAEIDLAAISQKVLEPFLQSDDVALKANGLTALESLLTASEKAATTLLHASPAPLQAIISMISRPPAGSEGRRAQSHAAECIFLAMGSRKTRQSLVESGGVDMLLNTLSDGEEGSAGLLRAKLLNVLAMLAGHDKEIREEVFDRLDFLVELRYVLETVGEHARDRSADRKEVRRLCQGLYQSSVCLTIHGEFKEKLVDAKHTLKAMLNLVTADDLSEDANLAYLYASIVYNLCRSREDKVRPKTGNPMLDELDSDDLQALEEFYEKLPAESRPEKNGEVDSGSIELASKFRSWCVKETSEGQKTSLVISCLAKCLAGSARAKNLTAMSFKFLCAEQNHRRIIATSGGLRACLRLVDLQDDLSRDAARQSLAQILIVTNPNLLQYSEQLDAVRPLVELLGHRHELLQFEAAMGLTNLLSASDELRARAIQANAWTSCRDLAFSDNEQVQRAGLEAMCNLCMAEEIVERFATGKAGEDLKIFAAFSLAEDMPTQVACTGALAMLGAYEEVAVRISALENFGNLLELMREATDDRIEHRVASLLCNIASLETVAPEVIRRTKAVLHERSAKGLTSPEAKALIQDTLSHAGA